MTGLRAAIFLALLLPGCRYCQEEAQPSTVQMGALVMTMPANFEMVPRIGTEEKFLAVIVDDQKDTCFTVELGRPPFVDSLQEDLPGRKVYYRCDTTNGIVTTVVRPKKVGQGLTGIYIPELKDSFSLAIWGKNLDSAKQMTALRMFRTIRYR